MAGTASQLETENYSDKGTEAKNVSGTQQELGGPQQRESAGAGRAVGDKNRGGE